MADGIRAIVCDAVTLGIVWPDRVILDVPHLMAQPMESPEPVEVKPTLAAERAPAHHPKTTSLSLRFILPAGLFACVLVPAEVGKRR